VAEMVEADRRMPAKEATPAVKVSRGGFDGEITGLCCGLERRREPTMSLTYDLIHRTTRHLCGRSSGNGGECPSAGPLLPGSSGLLS